jgi:threonine dehydrogenase-like Zn-dependent dehydrogenase
MQTLMFVGRRRLEWREVERPVLRAAGDVLVRPFVATRCDGDKLFLLHDFEPWLRLGACCGVVAQDFRSKSKDPFAAPFAYGHEGIAEVLECGAEVQRLRSGDHVVVPWALSCGTCPACVRGRTSVCEAGTRGPRAFGFGKAFGDNGGMLADCVRVANAEHMLLEVPRGVDPVSLASAGDNLCDAYRTVAPALKERPGAPVLVVGGAAASIGLYAAGMAVALGAEQVDYVDTNRERLAVAERLGANPVELRAGSRWFRSGAPARAGGYAISVEASSDPRGLHYALRALAPEGTCTAVGFYLRRGTPLPLWEMYLKGVTFKTGLGHARGALPDVLELVSSGRFDPATVTSVVADWSDAPRLFTEPHIKPVVVRAPLAREANAA